MTRQQLAHLLQQIIAFLFYGLVILTPLLWTSKTSELFEFPKMLSVYTFSTLIIGVWLARMAVSRQLILKKTFLDIPLIALLISQILSTLFSIDRHTSIYGYYSRFHGGLLSTISYILLYYAAVSNLKFNHIKNLLYSFLIGGVLASLYAFPEHFGGSPSCAIITGKLNVACWVQDVKTRVFGTFGQPNWLAAYLISIFFIPISFLTSESGSIKKALQKPTTYLWLATSILYFLVLLFTKSRSGILGLTLGYILFWIFIFTSHLTHRLNYKKTVSHPQRAKRDVTNITVEGSRRLFGYFVAFSLLLLSLYLLFGKSVVPQIDAQISRLTRTIQTQTPSTQPATVNPPPATITTGTQLESGGTESGTIRQIVWTGAYNLFKEHPIFGSGVETFAYGYYNVRPAAHNLVSEWDFLYNKAHNEWLNILSTTGIVGFIAFISIILVYLLWSIKQILSSKPTSSSTTTPTLIALISGYIALTVSNFLGFSTVPVGLIFFLFPAISLGLVSRTNTPLLINAEKKKSAVSGSQYIIMIIITIVAILALLRIGRMYRSDTAYAAGKAYQDRNDLLNTLAFFEKAYTTDSKEPLYTDQLSLTMAQAAIVLNQSGQSSQAAELTKQAVMFSNHTIQQNKVHLNYWKTRARVFIHLTNLDPNYLYEAQKALLTANALSPTDPKIIYNLGLIQEQLGNQNEAFAYYRQSIELKPNYQDVRIALAKAYEEKGEIDKAIENYQYILDHISPNDSVSKENIQRLQNIQSD